MNAKKKGAGWLVGLLLSGLMTTGLVACATQAEPTTATDEAEVATCCSEGAYTCSTNLNIEVDYAPPGCGAALKPRAQTACAAACGHACHDSGWIDTCP
jgi:hypothetical protein